MISDTKGGEIMAVIETPKSSAVSVKLNAGMDYDTGRALVRSCPLGKVLPNADKGAIMDVADLLAAVLAYPAIRVERTEVSILERD